jgi:glycine/D-amino acid oxidase-like deaminating enzyme
MDFDVAILGNGSIASALALRLAYQHPSLRVALIGPAARRGSASLAAGAMLNVFAELEPGALDSPLARTRFAIALAATALWDEHLKILSTRLTDTPPVRVVPGTYLIAADARDDGPLEAIVGYLSEHRQLFREVDPHTVVGLAPHPPLRRAVYLENEGMVSSRHLHRAYDEALATFPQLTRLDAEATNVLPGASSIAPGHTIHTRDLQLTARHVVLAAGVGTQRLVEQLGLAARVPRILHGVGVSLVLRTAAPLPTAVVRTPRRGNAWGVYLVPYGDGHCYVGATSEIAETSPPAPSPEAVAYLRGAAASLCPALAEAELRHVLLGSRPTTLDGYPLIGRVMSLGVPDAGVWIASGTRRDGFHLSPKIAIELAAAITTGSQPFGGAFAPERAD